MKAVTARNRPTLATDKDLRSSCIRSQAFARTHTRQLWPDFCPDLKLSVGDTLANGRFELRKLLGYGGMGAVYEAHDRNLGIAVALKLLRKLGPSCVFHFRREFRSLAGVEHPNIVQTREFFSGGGRWFYTMELVPGEPFDVWVMREKQLRMARIRSGFAQLADALDALHQLGKVHCDVKPQNVIATEQGRVVLVDFGLVRHSDPRGQHPLRPRTQICGTPEYMAPEQAAGGQLSSASDAYALGVMLYEALCGFLPFDGALQTVLFAKQTEQAMPPSALATGIPRELELLCLELLEREPSRRPSCAAISARLASSALPL